MTKSILITCVLLCGSHGFCADVQPAISLESNGDGTLLPAEVIDLSPWKLTLPVPNPKKERKPGKAPKPWEFGMPDLATFSMDPWFTVVKDADGTAVQFRANHGAITTSGSKNPRSELREMQPGYPKYNSMYNASWGTNDESTHSLWIKQKVTHLTSVKPHTVCGQIHDDDDDITVIRVEGHGGGEPNAKITTANIWITDNDHPNEYLVDGNYVLGTIFTVKIIASRGTIHYEYNGNRLPYSQNKSTQGCYFKMGNYTQSNDFTAPTETDTAYAETLVYDYKLDHQKNSE